MARTHGDGNDRKLRPVTGVEYYTEENPGGPYSRGLKAMAEKERQ
jgi:hypothetical protein